MTRERSLCCRVVTGVPGFAAPALAQTKVSAPDRTVLPIAEPARPAYMDPMYGTGRA
jgi:hypothetical protein